MNAAGSGGTEVPTPRNQSNTQSGQNDMSNELKPNGEQFKFDPELKLVGGQNDNTLGVSTTMVHGDGTINSEENAT